MPGSPRVFIDARTSVVSELLGLSWNTFFETG